MQIIILGTWHKIIKTYSIYSVSAVTKSLDWFCCNATTTVSETITKLEIKLLLVIVIH